MENNNRLEVIIDTIDVFRAEKEVCEVRILKTKQGTISGYFDESNMLAKAVLPFVGKYDIYFTLNPVKYSLLARKKNRIEGHAKHTTSDKDIEKINYILIDLDPVRPAGISSSEEEHSLALNKAEEIKDFLLDNDFPEPLVADSGNGYHLVYCTDLSNNTNEINRVKDFLNTLDFLFSDDKVQVDTTTFNPSRIIKLYGTIACKGDDTKERPHRLAQLIDVPEELLAVDIVQLDNVIKLMPNIESKTKREAKVDGSFNLEDWLVEHGIDIAYSGSFHNKGTKYVLKCCPWNLEHKDKSAYIIRFNNGAIAAGCHHNSCSHENWQTLRDLLEPEWRTKGSDSSENSEKESAVDIILRLIGNTEFFLNEIEETYAAIEIDDHKEVYRLKNKKFKAWLQKMYYEETGKAITIEVLNQVFSILEMKATYSRGSKKLERRVSKDENYFYYDLVDEKWRVVRISDKGCQIDNDPPVLFIRNKNMKQQVDPDFTVDIKALPKLINKHFGFKKKEDQLLYIVYLVTCFIPDIPHPILLLYGEKGSAKSTTIRMTRSIVDPAIRDTLSMPTGKADLALVFANNYMPSFDNLDSISAEKSDMICTAVTGGGFSKRRLYTDDEETILSFKRCITLNGINIVATRSDLLDRSILTELERIQPEDRKTENEVWRNFEKDKPQILGACLKALSKAMEIYPSIKLDRLGRMADFTLWGYAVAEALGIGGERFLSIYLNNQNRANDEAILSNPVAAAIMVLMKEQEKWTGSVAELLKCLEEIAEEERINTKVRVWPKAGHVLSKRLKEVKSNLEQVGIYFGIRHAGDFKEITIQKTTDIVSKDEREANKAEKTRMRKEAIKKQADLRSKSLLAD